MKDINKKIRTEALLNAVSYNGKANSNAVLSKIMIFVKDKSKAGEVMKEVNKIVQEVNKLSLDKQKEEIERLHIEKVKKKIIVKKIPNLKNAKKDKVVMRFAPNPNGPMSIGHARTALWNWFLVDKYKGKYILRFDDTDPRIKVPMKEAYSWFKEDLRWLGIKISSVVIQSSRLKIYYKHAEELIKNGYAYVDTLPQEEMRKKLWKNEITDEREDSVQEVMKKWKGMFTKYKDGEAVLRIKTDIDHPNPAVREWVAFRIIRNGKHPLVKAKVWPLLNFSSAIDDHLLKVTHILRGGDLKTSDQRQKYVYDYFKWNYPETIYHGKFLVAGIKSTSEIKELIKEGKISGWDDPRLGTLQALRRKGFRAEAIVNFIKENGLNLSDINISMEKVGAYNRDIIDKTANRYFLILNPKKVIIKSGRCQFVDIPLHPDFPKVGSRKIKGVCDEFYLQDDVKYDQVYRLMYLFNFKNGEILSDGYDPKLKAKMIHWLPVSKDLVDVEVVMQDNSVKKGYGESDLRNVKVNDVIQAERIGFMRLEKRLKNKMIFVFGHK
ncbi:MAG: glutamate--tRNA ligase [Nanoarchaeota archaeon]